MPETIGHYEVLERLGPGSLGDRIRARDTRLGRTVAIVVVDDALVGRPGDREAFLEDARRATALSHPSIASLYEVGEDGGRLYLVWEFVPGSSLRAFMGDRPLNPVRALGLAVQIADALADGHAHRIVHGDVNPETIVVTPTGRAKLIDFGLSRWTPDGRARAAAGVPCEAGASSGSVAYMSPEQALGGKVDRRTDVFSLGSVLFEMLTGEPPFAPAGQDASAVRVLQRVLPAPSSLNPRVPPEVDEVLHRALMKNPGHRESSAAALSAALKAIALRREEVAPEPVPAAVTAGRGPSRAALWALLVVVVLSLVAGWYWRDEVVTFWRQVVSPSGAPASGLVSSPGSGRAA